MALRVDIRSFPVIAAAALLLAAGLGFAMGMAGGGVTPVQGADTYIASSGRAEVTRPGPNRGTREAPTRIERGSDTGRGPSRPTDVRRQPDASITPVPARNVPEGRNDPIVQAPSLDAAASEIQVTLSDDKGRQLFMADIALDIQSGPLGWQVVSSQPDRIPGERGVFVFKGLYAGDYRVRSTAANYSPAEQLVSVAGTGGSQRVGLVLQGRQNTIVEFVPRFSDGTKPEQVQIMQNRNLSGGTSQGRFGQYKAPAGGNPREIIRPISYWIPLGPEGVCRVPMAQGVEVEVSISAPRETAVWAWSSRFTPAGDTMRMDATLTQTAEATTGTAGSSAGSVTINVALTVNGASDRQFTHVTLRGKPDDFVYQQPSSTNGNQFSWTVSAGTWYLVAEVRDVNARFVAPLETSQAEHRFDIKTGNLRVNAQREPGSPDPESADARYRVRIWPLGVGTLETSYNGEFKGKNTDYIDFVIPEGEYEVRVDSAEGAAPIVAEPPSQPLKMATGGQMSLTYTIRAGSSLKFRCVNSLGTPFPNAEYLLSFHPAGSVPESEKPNVRKGDPDGTCKTESAPYGAVYLHIWTTSADWNNPDKVFKLDLPAYGTKDLGNVVAAP